MKQSYHLLKLLLSQKMILIFIAGFLSFEVMSQSEKDPKVDPNLKKVYEKAAAATQRGGNTEKPEVKGLSASDDLLQIFNGKIVIEAIAKDDSKALLKSLQDLGLEKGAAFGGMVSGLLPIEAIPKLSGIISLKHVRPAYKPSTNIGAVTSQGDKAQYSDIARKNFKVQGFTTKVGILSDSYNNLNGASSGISTGDLPGSGNPNGYTNPVEVLEDFPSGGSDEGRAMAEIVHDVAPGASLAFHTAFLGQAGFAQGIIDLAEAGCNVIVDDVIYFAEPMFQDGIIAQAADQVVKGGAAFFSSAGNNLDQSYESEFRGGDGETLELRDYFSGDFIGDYVLHDFDPGEGVDHFQRVTIPTGGGALNLSFQWDDPFASACEGCPGAQSEMDIFLAIEDGDYSSMLIYPYIYNVGGDAVEILQVSNSGPPIDAYIVIGKYVGDDIPGPNPNPGVIKYVDFGPGANPEYATKSGTAYGHANSALSLAVGAVRYDRTPAFDVSPPIREVFSSSGGVPIFFDKKGNRIKRQVRKKPEFSAPQGGNTTFFGFDYEGDGFPNFFGTSASAPHAAGIASLMLEASGTTNLSPFEIKKFLIVTAIDMEDPFTPNPDPGFDFGTGFGLVAADKAVGLAHLKRYIAALRLTSVCSSEPAKERKWSVTNPNNFDVVVDWEIFKSDQKGKIIAKAKSNTYFYTKTISRNANLAIINYKGLFGTPYFQLRGSGGKYCPEENTSPVARTSETYSSDIKDELSLASLPDEDLLKLYPNPVNDNLSVSFLIDWEEDFRIELIDPIGKIAYNEQKRFSDQNFNLDIQMNTMRKGMYILRMTSETRTITRKFLKD